MSKTYSYPKFHWWQFIKKRRMAKALSRLSAGERISFRTKHLRTELPTFTDDFTVSAFVELTTPREGDTDE